VPGGTWARAAAVKPSPTGLDLALRATAPIEARLTAGAASTDPVRIAVAPRVTLRSPGSGRLTGSVKPVVPGARVTVQRRTADGTAWRVVTTVAVPSSGAWQATMPLAASTYRARVGGIGGYAPGVSTPLAVAGP
jgi:hypothetical protein